MRRNVALFVTMLTLTATALAGPTATFSVNVPLNGQVVTPGTQIDWTIQFTISEGDNFGAALVCCDLVQDAGNPAFLNLPPASGVPAGMANFNRPEGVSNPGEGGAASGYIGVQRGDDGAKNLIQIGGGQNTFGASGGIMGTNPYVVAGVGQGGAQTLASGSFPAPATAGTYTFKVMNALVNVLTEVNEPPDYSPVIAAITDASAAAFTFTVGAYAIGDLNCDGLINAFDIDPFVLALTSPESYAQSFPHCNYMLADINGDGMVNAFDIDPFVILLTSGGK